MKKIIYVLFAFSVLLTSCTNDDDTTEEVENIGSVTGTWAFSSSTASVETSASSSVSIILNPLLQTALSSYAGSNEPSYYTFDASGNFGAYVIDSQTSEAVLNGSGTYTLVDNTLTLTYVDSESSSSSSVETFEIIVANTTTLKIRKDYSSSLAYWGAGILANYVSVDITSAKATMTYVIND